MILQNEFEDYLRQRVLENTPSRTKEAMSYSLMNGGKRIRPQLLFAALEQYGVDPRIGFPCACAIEMIHTYSLIHDDLPAMDDDDLRRGHKSCHKQYDEATAILAGDGLLTKAFDVVLDSSCSDAQIIDLVRYLSRFAGIDGMIYGQELDMMAERNNSKSFELLLEIDVYKTAKLLTLPLVCACILTNNKEDICIMEKIGFDAGVQFQIQDDILDVTQSKEILGKSTSDIDNDKMTAVSLLGLENAKKKVKELEEDLQSCMKQLKGDTSSLESLLNYLSKRTY